MHGCEKRFETNSIRIKLLSKRVTIPYNLFLSLLKRKTTKDLGIGKDGKRFKM